MGVKQKKYKNGEEYNGDWSNNKRHGFGIHSWPDNRIYVCNLNLHHDGNLFDLLFEIMMAIGRSI